MIRGTTTSGFEFLIEDSALNDWELIELIDELEDKPNYMVRIAKKLIGNEQYRLLKKHCTKDGKVQLDMMTTEITELLNSNQETKN